jgi:transcription antitermination factor NusG
LRISEAAVGQDCGLYPWFALRVRSNYERVAALHLRDRGFDEFSPTFKAERQWSDRKKQIDQFLFPGYVFCRINPEDRLPVLSIPGAVGLVAFGKGPAAIPENEIESVRTMVGSGLLVGPWPFLAAGQSVLIEHGPLTGLEGLLLEVKKAFRLIVSVSLLQRSVSVEIDRNWVRPLASVPKAEHKPGKTSGVLVVQARTGTIKK